MKISEIFDLEKSQYELDFVDIDIDKDIPLFLDPYFISKMEFPLAEDAYSTLRDYFNYLLALLRQGYMEKAEELFSYLGESNEICLGMSKGKPSGKGMGPTDADKIFKGLIESKAYDTGLMEDIEDFRIFVPNVDKDKVSDMTANIIRFHLIKYTQEQCKIWGIPLTQNVPSGYYWSRDNKDWENKYTDMLVIARTKVILVPKRIVSYSKEYTSKEYTQHFILNYFQHEHLRLQTSLVKKRADGSQYVTKKDVLAYVEGSHRLDKRWLAKFTLEHPDVFSKFKSETIKKIKSISNEELCQKDIKELTDYLIIRLKEIPPGPDYASVYHKTVVGIMELLFYPQLSNPMIEQEIHEGRKRIDITFDNCAETGFFFRLGTINALPSRFIIIECKNYSRDLANPELDQLSGRFSPNRGQFGIAACRNIDDMELFLKRCADTFKDGRGLIIPIVDDDLIEMLNDYPSSGTETWERIFQKRFHAVAIR